VDKIECDTLEALTDEVVPPPPGFDPRLTAVLARRWQSIAGLGIPTSVLLLAASSIWATWRAARGVGPTGELSNASIATSLSDALVTLGLSVPGVLSLIGIVALAAYVASARPPHVATSALAGGFVVVGAIYWVASIWTFARSFDRHAAGHAELAAGTSRMVYASGFIASGVIVALALAVLSVRTRRRTA
jgi:hypothetical protein